MPLDSTRLPPPRISDDDYLFAYPLVGAWAIAFAIFTPSILTSDGFRGVNAALMTVVAVSALVCFISVLQHTTLTVERIAVWGVTLGLTFYGVLQLALGVYYIVTIQNTDRVPLVLLVAFTVVLTNRRRRWLTKQRRQVSAIAAAHPEVS